MHKAYDTVMLSYPCCTPKISDRQHKPKCPKLFVSPWGSQAATQRWDFSFRLFLATDEQDHSLNQRFKTKRVNSCGPTNRERSSVHMFGLFDVPQSTSNEVRGACLSHSLRPRGNLRRSPMHIFASCDEPQYMEEISLNTSRLVELSV